MIQTLESIRTTALEEPSADHLAQLGRALAAREEWDEAIEIFERVTRMEPSKASYAIECAGVMLQARRPDQAHTMYLRAHDEAPESAAICEALGRLHKDYWDDTGGAEDWFVRSLQLASDFEDSYVGLCRVFLMRQREPDEAAATIVKRVGPVTQYALLYRGMAQALEQMGRYHEGRCYWQKAPRDVAGLLGLTNNYLTTREIAAADRCSSDAVQQAPSSFKAHIDRARFLQMTGQVDEAKAVFRRFFFSHLPGPGEKLPQWDGSSLEGKRVVLEFGSGSGYGDLVQHCGATAHLLRKAGAEVIVECPQKRIHSFLTTAHAVSGVVQPFDPRPLCDFRVDPAQALALLSWNWEDIQSGVPYFHRPAHTSPLPLRSNGSLQVGLHWMGGDMFRHDVYQYRSMPSEYLRELTTMAGIAAHSFQLGATSLPPATMDLAPHLREFTDTAAAVLAMDLMITVDSSIGHLAGVLGRPCLLMVPYCAAAQWMLAAERSDQTPSRWYPATTIFRQPSPGDWTSVVRSVAAHLQFTRMREFAASN